ncbi:MAG: hypothetical protein AAFY29_05530 [Pseudomonadota bacterium]
MLVLTGGETEVVAMRALFTAAMLILRVQHSFSALFLPAAERRREPFKARLARRPVMRRSALP